LQRFTAGEKTDNPEKLSHKTSTGGGKSKARRKKSSRGQGRIDRGKLTTNPEKKPP